MRGRALWALLAVLAVETGCSYAVVADPGPPLGAATRTRVFAQEGWQDTQILVGPGDRVELRATGTWDPGGSRPCTAAGAHFPLYRYSPLFLLFYLPNPAAFAPLNELLLRVGADGPVIRVGARRAFEVATEGQLMLRPNDWYLGNGSGYVDVEIAIRRAGGPPGCF